MARNRFLWIGFSGGKPHVWRIAPVLGGEEVISVSPNRRRVNYEDVRLCRIVEVRKKGKHGK